MSLKLMKSRWMSSKEEAPGSHDGMPPHFIPIDERIVLCDDAISKEPKAMRCGCTTSEEERSKGIEACGSGCLNRLLFMECGSRCPCGDFCSNKRFQKREYVSLEAFFAGDKGWGLRTRQAVKQGSFVIEYMGEVLDAAEYARRRRRYGKDCNHTHHYFMALRNGAVIDATVKGNLSRFLNHSCDANLETQKWTVDRQLRIGFFAKRDIEMGEEVCIDYKFERYGREAQKCLCGAANCRGVIGMASEEDNKDDDDVEDEEEEEEEDEEDEEEEGPKVAKTIARERRLEKKSDDLERKVDALERELKEPNQIPRLLRLMLRVRSPPLRSRLLSLLLRAGDDSSLLRRFIEKGGLRLVFLWLMDDRRNVRPLLMLRSRLLVLLDALPVANLNQLTEARLISTLTRLQQSKVSDEEIVDDLMPELVDRVVGTWQSDEPDLCELHERCAQQVQRLLNKWSLLHEAFRIPRRVGVNASRGESLRVRSVIPQHRPASSHLSWAEKRSFRIRTRIAPSVERRGIVTTPCKTPTPTQSTNIACCGVRRRPSRFDQAAPIASNATTIGIVPVGESCLDPVPMQLSPGCSPQPAVATASANLDLLFPAVSSSFMNGGNSWMPNLAAFPSPDSQSSADLLVVIRGKIVDFERQLSLLRTMEAQLMQRQTVIEEPARESGVVLPPPPPPAVAGLGALPAASNWATASDPQGNLYYYNIITRESRWDPPDEEEGGSSVGAVADTTTLCQESRANFKSQMAKHVAALLEPYRKTRFTSITDYKYTLRKLTHTIMEKELKRKCSSSNYLEVTDSVKDKAKKYVSDYMKRLGENGAMKKATRKTHGVQGKGELDE